MDRLSPASRLVLGRVFLALTVGLVALAATEITGRVIEYVLDGGGGRKGVASTIIQLSVTALVVTAGGYFTDELVQRMRVDLHRLASLFMRHR
jgi:hypothetical protein